MEKIVYVTGNYGKYISVKEQFEEKGIDIDFFKFNIAEPEINDIKLISKAKALESYTILKRPCFAADSGFYIDDYPNNPGYPGAFVNRSGIGSNIEDLLKTMENVSNRNCRFVDCLTFYDGKEFYTFYGISKGSIAFKPRGNYTKKAKSKLWYIFIPENYQKTLTEMTDEERKIMEDKQTSATQTFANWYKNEYSTSHKTLIKSL